MRKLVGKRRFWSYKVWKLEGVSHEMLVLRLQHVSSRFSVFFLQSWLQYVVMSFCVAGVALRDILMCLQLCRNSFLCGSHTILSRCVLYTPHPTLHTPHFTLYTLQFTLYNFHSTLYTLHSRLYTLHSTLHTPHCRGCHGICTLSQLHAAVTMRFAKTPNTTRLKCCVRHAKWRWRSPKCCACHKKCNASSENVTKVLRLPHKTTFDTLRNTSECHEVPRPKRGYAAFESSKSDHFYRTHHRHGHMALSRSPPNGCGRLRNVWRTQPQPPDPQSEKGTLATRSGNAWKSWKNIAATAAKPQSLQPGEVALAPVEPPSWGHL